MEDSQFIEGFRIHRINFSRFQEALFGETPLPKDLPSPKGKDLVPQDERENGDQNTGKKISLSYSGTRYIQAPDVTGCHARVWVDSLVMGRNLSSLTCREVPSSLSLPP